MRIPVTRWPEVAHTLYRTFGARGLGLRIVHEVRRKSHRFRARPRFEVLSSSTSDMYRIDRSRLAKATHREMALERAERVLRGEFQAYRTDWRKLPGESSDWLRHPITRRTHSPNRPWWQIRHLDSAFGDIKDLWEPARFSWLYDLIRAYALTEDDRYAASALEHVKHWAISSPPFEGPHWSCGQESSIRAIALLYAESNLADASSVDESAHALLRKVLAATGERVADAIGYAVSQRNNHAISEAAGLVLLGVRFRGEHPESEQWIETGHQLLERSILEQFESDGWYVQHSFTYTRLALEQCVLAERALGTIGRAIRKDAVLRLTAAVELIAKVMEPESGIVPNHGANDGAYIHPVTLAGYRDFRTVLTEVSSMWRHPLPRNIAIDEEALVWLNLGEPPRKDAGGDGLWSGKSGWIVARKGPIQLFMRAARYTSRPAHIDSLHLDLRYGDKEIIVDPGTYAYNAPPPWNNGLAGGAVHNGPLLDGQEPGVKGPRFLWYLWPEARLLSVRRESPDFVILAERPGAVRRRVTVRKRTVEICDTVHADNAKTMRIRWLLHPSADPSCATVEDGIVHHAREDSTAGWYSPHYGERIPSRFIEVKRRVEHGSSTVATFSFHPED